MVELIKYIINELAEQKDAVEVEIVEESERVNVINVKVAKSDMGRVIGKNGKIASAIRTIIKSLGSSSKRYILKIGEKEVE